MQPKHLGNSYCLAIMFKRKILVLLLQKAFCQLLTKHLCRILTITINIKK